MGEVYALDIIFQTLFAFRVKALHQVMGSLGCFFTDGKGKESFVVAVTLFIPCRNGLAALATRDGSGRRRILLSTKCVNIDQLAFRNSFAWYWPNSINQ